MYGDRGAKMDSNELVVATGGMALSRDMGRWSEKKDAILTSAQKILAIELFVFSLLAYQAFVGNL